MQVKKFEASTIQEALEMVKSQLGPDAIILSARDNKKSFGLVGKGSVEVTAAVDEMQLKKKQFVESKLREKDRSRFQVIPARVQKEIIEKSVSQFQDRKSQKHVATKTKYIDIQDTNSGMTTSGPRSKSSPVTLKEASPTPVQGGGRRVSEILDDMARDYDFASRGEKTKRKKQEQSQKEWELEPVQARTISSEVAVLKEEIGQLREAIKFFQIKAEDSRVRPHPGAEYQIPYEMSYVFEKLMSVGVAADVIVPVLHRCLENLGFDQIRNRGVVESWVAGHLLENVRVTTEKPRGRFQVFVGPSSTGKTSTLVKMASYYVLNQRKKVGIVTVDASKVGAVDQLRTYAQILNVPFGVVRSSDQWTALDGVLAGCDLIFVDFPGLSLKSLEEQSQYKSILPQDGFGGRTIHYVQSVNARDSEIYSVTERYLVCGPLDDVIFTKLDESIHHGVICNFQNKFSLPLNSFGIGQTIPEDFEFATPERVVDLILQVSKFRQFNEKG